MADYGVDQGGFPLSSLEATGDLTTRQQRRLNQITPEQFADLFPTGEELKRRRVALKDMCDRLGWEFVGEP